MPIPGDVRRGTSRGDSNSLLKDTRVSQGDRHSTRSLRPIRRFPRSRPGFLGVLSIILVVGQPVSGQEVHLPEFGLTLHLEEGWIPIPDSLVSRTGREASQLAGEPINYVAGFQRRAVNSTTWFDPPYVLYQVFTTDLLTPDELLEIRASGLGLEEMWDRVERSAESIGSGVVERGAPVWDSDLQLLFESSTIRKPDGTHLRITSVSRGFRGGILSIHLYDVSSPSPPEGPGEKAARVRARLEALGQRPAAQELALGERAARVRARLEALRQRSVAQELALAASFAPEWRHRSTPNETPDSSGIWERILARSVSGGIAGLFVALVLFLFRRKRDRGGALSP